ncbi:hypothetical protein MNBD_GAMMA11-481 [hydrothermal vent metagenome]|uniref:N-acetyltransferase domain-containing protein n=1 Tax=hydrothermal vent metagenome TaxID=652676 RepID=A0A3B0WWY5_9ZZZZ
MSLEIRRADISDAKAISFLIMPLVEKYVTHELSEKAATAFLASISVDGIKQKLAHDFSYFIALSDNELTGTLGINKDMHIYHLFVSEKHHNKGIARRLLITAREAFSTSGIRQPFTVNSSMFARVFYEKMGFSAQSAPQTRNGITTISMKSHL